MLELHFTPNYHNMFTWRESLWDFACVSTDVYHARWEHLHPHTVFFRGLDDTQPDWIELEVGGYCTMKDGAHLPDMDTFRPDFASEEKRRNFVIPDGAPYEESGVSLRFSASSFAGGKYFYTVVFYRDHAELHIRYELPGSFALARAEYCLLTPQRGTVFASEVMFDPCPTANCVQYTSLNVKHVSGSNGERWFSPAPFCYPIKMRDGSWISVSAAPGADQLDFTGFAEEPREIRGSSFALDYTALPRYADAFDFPALVFRFGASAPYDALRAYADGLVTSRGSGAGSPTGGGAW